MLHFIFTGWTQRALKTIRRLIDIFPDDTTLWNDLGTRYLLARKVEDARESFKQVSTLTVIIVLTSPHSIY